MVNKKIYFLAVLVLLVLNFYSWRECFTLYDNNLKVYFLDVGQGDSALIETPSMHQIIIDGGPDSTVLSRLSSILPFWDRDLDMIILTHPDKDHMQGLIYVLQNYKVDYIVWTGVKKNSAEYDIWIKEVKKQKLNGAKIVIAEKGKNILIGKTNFNILNPFNNVENQEIRVVNDTSIIFNLVFGKNKFLFTGDITSKVEKELELVYPNLSSDILKVAHHGSKYSTEESFLSVVNPSFAVISVGKNSYGHPTQEVLQRLEKFGINIFRTDQQGTVLVKSNGENINIYTTKLAPTP